MPFREYDRTDEGMAAVNGEKLRMMKVLPEPEKGELYAFEEACQNYLSAMTAVRTTKDLPFHYEKTDGKLADSLIVFVGRSYPAKGQGNPHSGGDDDSKSKSDKTDAATPMI